MRAAFLSFVVVLTTAVMVIGCQAAPPDTAVTEASIEVSRTISPNVSQSSGDTLAGLDDAQVVDKLWSELRMTRPGVIAGATRGSLSQTGNPIVYIKGTADDAIEDILAGVGVPVDLVENQPYNEDELQGRVMVVYEALEDMGYSDVKANYEVADRGVIRASVYPEDGLPSNTSEILASLPEDISAMVALSIRNTPTYIGKTIPH